MTQIKNFSEFEINDTTEKVAFVGDKMKIERLFNRDIVIYDYLIADSTKVEGTKCLWLQIAIGEIKYVVFSGSKKLLKQVEKLPQNALPFHVKIIREDNGCYKFIGTDK